MNSEAKSTREQCLGFLLPRSFSSYLVMEGRAEKVKRSNYPVMLAHKHHFADWSVIKFGHF